MYKSAIDCVSQEVIIPPGNDFCFGDQFEPVKRGDIRGLLEAGVILRVAGFLTEDDLRVRHRQVA